MANIAEAAEEEFENNNAKAAQIWQCLNDLSKSDNLMVAKDTEIIAFYSDQTLWVDALYIDLIGTSPQEPSQ
jgi:hypothetical protein|tara:strand:- start:1315 stop:1530 length:216 start_codon:yes stop_codon:yes gene_type:complete